MCKSEHALCIREQVAAAENEEWPGDSSRFASILGKRVRRIHTPLSRYTFITSTHNFVRFFLENDFWLHTAETRRIVSRSRRKNKPRWTFQPRNTPNTRKMNRENFWFQP